VKLTDEQLEALDALLAIHATPSDALLCDGLKTPCNRRYILNIMHGQDLYCDPYPFTTSACKIAVMEVLGVEQPCDVIVDDG
jgi:hypothetical protein